MKLALVQFNPTVGALRQNRDCIRRFFEKGRQAGAALVVFPELALTGYPPQDLLLYRGFLQEVEEVIYGDLAPLTAGDSPSMLLGAPFRHGPHLYNAAVLLAAGEMTRFFAKTLLPNYDIFDEQRYFTPASRRLLWELDGCPAGVTICEDIWNDRDLWPQRRYALDPLEELAGSGARLIINISASPYHLGKQALREKMLSSLAAKYRMPFIYLNQVGGNDELIFDGASLVYNFEGHLVQRGTPFEEEIIIIDTANLFQPAAALPPVEEGIGSVYKALLLGIRDYLYKSGFSKAAIGLSGGIDSAVTAALAVAALGKENVLGVLMPSPYSPDHSVEDALALARNLGIEHRQLPIDGPLHAFRQLLNQDLPPGQDLAEENLQARLRGNILMFISNREGAMVLTTGNKSELAAGYCTLYGDMAGGLAVLADVPKMMVYELAHYINTSRGKEIIPRHSITKPPSAELRPGQKDEDSLPAYPVLDPIMQLYVEENLSAAEIVARGYDEATVRRIINLVDRSEFKRRQAAPGLRVTARAFGRGRRMPIARG